ncbi:MAG: diaminopimelate epimerase [Bacteroidetes bacterium CG18_big_fil_WC_8_21_14_2_50_41_14]|nr:MAG: diaminopimelate epimerase [Bacteroidetes bacterium CG18_big_fil_WC_8_21_14_2_50_41_14]PJB58343.1 MAG: diaminopimelate epimerase [Bacteroidetes bacterium CG_4_9_14_3_um_filter_41_19]
MNLPFYKFHGNGNDFILVDSLSQSVNLTDSQIRRVCHRRFGVGADGLILVLPSIEHAFTMKYYNSDGLEGTMCGNGGRCVAAFAFMRGYATGTLSFDAFDGVHQAVVERVIKPGSEWFVSLQMQDVKHVDRDGDDFFLNTGSPHLVKFVNNVRSLDVCTLGKQIRYNKRPDVGGVNVNFVEVSPEGLFVRTYERGVEDETLSCGTGVTAAAIVAGLKFGENSWKIETPGGPFLVDYQVEEWGRTQIWLRGPAELICKGDVELIS